MNIVYCATSNYIEKAKPSIRSLREHNPDANIYIVTNAKEVDIEDVKVIDISDQQIFTKENCVNYFNMFTWASLMKVCYPSLLSVDKVIHMDCDTIICDSLKPLWNMKLKDKWFAMCQEYKGTYKPFGDRYYNAGVYVANLKQLRKDNIEPLMIDYLKTVRQPWGEQDALVKYALEQDKMIDIDTKYNETQFTAYSNEPVIVHYAGVGDWWSNQRIYRAEYLNRYR